MTKIDAAQVWTLNYRMMMSLMDGVAPAIRALHLEMKELFLLADVDEHPHPADLANALLMPKPTVTVIVKRLEAAGYLRRQIDASDLRRHTLTLTPAGRRAMTRGLAILSEAYGKRLARLTAREQAQLAAIIEKMS
jgi:DNA-binding MarR family transcriptional regulator